MLVEHKGARETWEYPLDELIREHRRVPTRRRGAGGKTG